MNLCRNGFASGRSSSGPWDGAGRPAHLPAEEPVEIGGSLFDGCVGCCLAPKS